MEKETILRACRDLEDKITIWNFYASAAELKNLIQAYAGLKSPFYEAVDKVNINASLATDFLDSIVKSFSRAVENDLVSGTFSEY